MTENGEQNVTFPKPFGLYLKPEYSLNVTSDFDKGLKVANYNKSGDKLIPREKLAEVKRIVENLQKEVEELKKQLVEAGNLLIQQTAGFLRKSFRTDDVIVRVGGDEFAVICRDKYELDDDEEKEDFYERVKRFDKELYDKVKIRLNQKLKNQIIRLHMRFRKVYKYDRI